MRVHAIPVIVSLFFYCSDNCFSQTNKEVGHPVIRDPKKPSIQIVQPSLADLYKVLGNATTHIQKADICFLISRYHSDRLKVDSALFYSERIKEESEKGNYDNGIGKYYLAKSSALYFRGQSEQEMLDKAIAIFDRHKDALSLASAYRLQAKYYDRDALYSKSREYYRVSIPLFNKVNAPLELQRVYHEMGRSFYMTFETDSAAFYLINALDLAEELGDSIRVFYAGGMLGELYLVTGDLDKAEFYLKYALDRRSRASRIELRNRLSSYASCQMFLGNFEKADAAIKEYEMLNEKMGDAWGAINYDKIKGTRSYYKENYTEALKYFQRAYGRRQEIKSFQFDIKNICFYLAKTEYNMGMYDSAIQHFKYSQELAKIFQFGLDIMETNLLISQCFEKKRNIDSAHYYYLTYSRIKDSIMTLQKEKANIELITKYETEKKEQQIQLLQREKELNAYQLRSKMDEIEKQNLANAQKSQQLSLLSQQSEINRLEASAQTLAFENQQKEMIKKQNELTLMEKEKELQAVITGKESQRKNFAYIAIIAILGFSGYVLYRFTQNKKLSRKLAVSLVELKAAQAQLIKAEKEKEAENIRMRISRDIHDEVGATLSGVALFSEIAREKMKQQQPDDAQAYLDHITINSKEMVEKMSDIVWTINPDNDSFERIIAKLQSYAVNLCAGKGIRLHFDINEQARIYAPSMQVRKNIYMLIKEAVNNAVKYSGGKNISLSLYKKEDEVTIEVKDDGKGFDINKNYDGNGLNNMKSRASDLGAKFTIDAQEGMGTNIRLQLNFHPAGGQVEVV